MSKELKQIKSTFSYDRDKLQHALNLFKVNIETLGKEIKKRDEEKFIFEPRELKTLINSLGAELFMVTIDEFLKKGNEFINEVDGLEEMEEIYKCPHANECINATGHCLRFNERIGEEGKERCFNFKPKEEKEKVVKEYTKTEDELRDFIRKSFNKNPKLINNSRTLKMNMSQYYKNINEEVREEIFREIMEEYKDTTGEDDN